MLSNFWMRRQRLSKLFCYDDLTKCEVYFFSADTFLPSGICLSRTFLLAHCTYAISLCLCMQSPAWAFALSSGDGCGRSHFTVLPAFLVCCIFSVPLFVRLVVDYLAWWYSLLFEVAVVAWVFVDAVMLACCWTQIDMRPQEESWPRKYMIYCHYIVF